jgi:acetyl-CoA/propionyl-CoA carboxylase biotin carboxyl carrier protein
VKEQVTGLDLVQEMYRIAAGEALGYADPVVSGHSIEFRINAEDAGRNFMPAPGTLTGWQVPAGPGVRLDAGYDVGETVPGSFDSLIAKLVVTGASRTEALARSRRALREFVIEGMPTVLPFHRRVVDDPAFVGDAEGFGIHTSWIETEFDNDIPPDTSAVPADEPAERRTVTVEVDGKRLSVSVPAGLGGAGGRAGAGEDRPVRRKAAKKGGAAVSGDALTSPMQGTIVKLAVSEGDTVEAGALVVVLEAMKMEQPINAHRAGTISGLNAEVGATVSTGAVICEITG